MWSEELDKKIKQLVESRDAADTGQGWNQMEAMLDKHLPREKRRRRIIFLFFLFVLTGTVVYFLTTAVNRNIDRTAANKKTVQATTGETLQKKGAKAPAPHTNDEGTKGSSNGPATSMKQQQKLPTPVKTELNISKRLQAGTNISKRTKTFEKKHDGFTDAPHDVDAQNLPVSPKKNSPAIQVTTMSNDPVTENGLADESEKIAANPTGEKTQDMLVDTSANNLSSDSSITQETHGNTDTVANTVTQQIHDRKSTASKNRLSFSLSAGPDISAVRLNNPGNVKWQWGIGVGYDISKRVTIRTGFFASRKLYTADSADYHPPKQFWAYYTEVGDIHANCMVYEIPLNVVYHFPSKKRHNWFVSGGLSSYLMKSEKYGYEYKNTWGQEQYGTRTFKNENNHFFSIMSLSGGYRYRFSNRFSISAEPYLRIPVAGVGFGKVKLNSGGLLFSATLRPFGK